VHVGFALARIDEEEAQRTLAWLEGLGQAYATELQP
jgi:hydrogenase maturation factor